MKRASESHGARARILRRVMLAWSHVAHKIRSLRERSQQTEDRMRRYHAQLVWKTWRRERHVQTIIEVAAVEKLHEAAGYQLALHALSLWRGDESTATLIRCWRDWRRGIHRYGW
jgi:hypothetical protein